MIATVSFSLFVNGALDKVGLIDPSTSTVFVGNLLGLSWGFVLDNMIGTDEGFREYLWSPNGGMLYAMGTLTTARFARSAFGACCVVAGSAHRGLDPVAEGFSAARRRRVAVLRPHGAKGFSGEGLLRWAGPTGADKRRSTSGHASMVWPATIAALVVIC